ncbi:hypothetical protein PVAP13_8NG223701 [Panicum virgatum]|uniref:Uncharacterized protein n=1 Tax=Panicum virgatum TaxID=38727 RepID=A0A8T0PBT6_PANVG|nr:hypothetical protein PVAP13_8NG223701 [Panicum virgatum]
MAELVTGQFMFDEDTEEKMMDLRHALAERGLQAFDEWPAFQGLPELSPGAREVLAGLHAVQPSDRLPATAALQHPWFAEEEVERPAATCRSAGRAARSLGVAVVLAL